MTIQIDLMVMQLLSRRGLLLGDIFYSPMIEVRTYNNNNIRIENISYITFIARIVLNSHKYNVICIDLTIWHDY